MNNEKINFSLSTVIFRNSKTVISDDFDPTIPGVELVGSFRVAKQTYFIKTKKYTDDKAASIDLHIAQFTTTYAFRYQTTEQDKNGNGSPESQFIVEITAEIVAEYFIDEPVELPNDTLNLWGGRNVLLHTWPYWREFVQSSMLKMGLPGMTMPILPPSFVAQPPQPTVADTI